MKLFPTFVAVLLLTAPAFAERRSVLLVVTLDKEGNAKVAIHSDDKGGHTEAVTMGDGQSKGHKLDRKDRKALFDAIDANV
jgi:hypothetical protein